MQSQSFAAPSLVLAGNYSAEHLYSGIDAFLESPMWRTYDPDEDNHSAPSLKAANDEFDTIVVRDVRLHLDMRRCTREHRLGDALALVHHLSGRVSRLDITVDNEAQAGFGEVITVIGKCHGLAVSVQ